LRQHYDEQGLEHPVHFWPPDTHPGAGVYLKALDMLAADRPVSVGFGTIITCQIPFASLVAFAKTYGIEDLDEFDGFVRIVRRLDAQQVAEINEKTNKKP
jgi:hypothetical protein